MPAEIVQAGIESFGRPDKAAADAEMLALGLDATAHYGIAKPEIRMGDVGLFSALVAALDLAPAWKRRLVKDFNRKTSLAHDLDVLTLHAAQNKPEYQGVLAALERSDPKAAHALVTDLLSIAGINTVGGRTVGEIAERFLEQAALGAATTLPGETRTLIEKFLAIAGDPDEAAAELRALAASAGLAHRAGARSVRKPHRISRRARRRRRPHPLLDRLWPRPRLLHRLRVRAARSGRRAERAAGRRRPLRRTADAGSARKRRSRRSALRSGSSASPAAEASHERAARHRRAVQGPAAGTHRGVLRPRRPATGQAARRPRLSRRDRRTCPASRSPICRPARSPTRWRRARSISASPARICCARRSPTWTSAW